MTLQQQARLSRIQALRTEATMIFREALEEGGVPAHEILIEIMQADQDRVSMQSRILRQYSRESS